ncbi:Pycsar system effector family protein [Streptomyces sp. NPDC021100]|uniref:Pycsar system effector family protein n=1 Tax=Streptomyces sp. NPDC021100 TaxID=3365114 RepID=UPI00379C35AC
MAVDPLDTAWKVQSALTDWTGKADTKASIALSLQSALLALVGVLTVASHGFRTGSVLAQVLGWAGILTLLAGACLAAAAVSPNLRSERRGPEPDGDYLFFGHLRHFEPEQLEGALRERDPLAALSRQMVVMSEIAWAKHRRVQWSFAAAVSGSGALAIAAVIG